MTTETSIYEYAKQSLIRFPDKVAIWYNYQSITYRDLFEKIDNFADYLYSIGVREGTVVTIYLSNCPEAIIAIYAVAKLGGICSMVHELVPEKSLDSYLQYTNSRVTITRNGKCSVQGIIITLENFNDTAYAGSIIGFFPSPSELAKKCAVYMQSSGTQGKPKTVMFSHLGMNNYIKNLKSFADYELDSIISLSIAPFFHIMGLLGDVHRTICTGAQMVLMEKFDVDQSIDFIKRYGINFLTGVPKMYDMLLKHPKFCKNELNSIDYCYIGGDSVSDQLLGFINKRFEKRVAFPVYGMTELGGIVCTLTNENYREGSSGCPIDNAFVMVMDLYGNISTSGEGEFVCHSESNMIGYLDDETATNNIMLRYNDIDYIKTGDYGRIDSDGYLYFISRIKNLIIHNGYCINPGEIETAIETVSSVSEVCVFGKKTKDNSECIFAVIAPKNTCTDFEYLSEQIKQAINGLLPKYAHPNKICFVNELPRNSMNKVDISLLKDIV